MLAINVMSVHNCTMVEKQQTKFHGYPIAFQGSKFFLQAKSLVALGTQFPNCLAPSEMLFAQ
jgi:hypothetical protein